MSKTYYTADTNERLYAVVVNFELLCCECAFPYRKKLTPVPVYLKNQQDIEDFSHDVGGCKRCFCSECGRNLRKEAGLGS